MSIRVEGRLISYDSVSQSGVVQTTNVNQQTGVSKAQLDAGGVSTTPFVDVFTYECGGSPTQALSLRKLA